MAVKGTEFLQRQIVQGAAPVNTVQDQPADNAVRVPEGHALPHQIIRRVRRIGKSVPGGSFHDILPEFHGIDHSGKQSQTALHRVDGVKGQLLVLLHILVIGQRKSLHRRQHGDERAVDPSCFPPDQLRDIRIFLLRHDGAACAVGVVNLHKPILICIPDTDFLAEAAQVHHDRGESAEQLYDVVPV